MSGMGYYWSKKQWKNIIRFSQVHPSLNLTFCFEKLKNGFTKSEFEWSSVFATLHSEFAIGMPQKLEWRAEELLPFLSFDQLNKVQLDTPFAQLK
jgi:hypothetical protein